MTPRRPILAAGLGLALVAAITSWSPLDGYQAELKRQCPDKQLDRLEPRDLRAVLQAFQATLPREAQAQLDEVRAASCSAAHDAMAASCETSAVAGELARQGRLRQAVAFVCANGWG